MFHPEPTPLAIEEIRQMSATSANLWDRPGAHFCTKGDRFIFANLKKLSGAHAVSIKGGFGRSERRAGSPSGVGRDFWQGSQFYSWGALT